MTGVLLSGTDIAVSRLSFGTASLHHLLSSRRRQDLLAAAFDQGFTHFDTAPSYGFGLAEIELGRLIRARRDKVTIATKFGLYPPAGAKPSTPSVWARKLVAKGGRAHGAPVVDWSQPRIDAGLNDSLRRLGVDYVDLLLLHEPVFGAFESEPLLAWLTAQREKGKVRAWGLAGGPGEIRRCVVDAPSLGVVLQLRDSVAGREADAVTDAGRCLQLTYGYLSSASSGGVVPNAREILERALMRNRTGSVLVSTRRIGRLKELSSVAA